MNKTTSINLGGYFFHIDEDAFRKLSNYFDAVRRSLSPDGREEIIKDIESRISEIFTEKLGTTKQVIGLKEVDDVIAIMGQPEDYKIEDETPKNEYYSSYSNTNYTTKKLYRDRENSLLGGVMSGLGHYFGVDPLWLRIIMVILFFGFGTGLVLYLILWVLVPEATTTSQKLEMRGEPITISNIEKKVKEGFSEISDKFNNLDHDKIAANAKNGAERIGNTLSDIITSIFKVISKIIGGFIVFFSSMSLLSVVIAGIAMLFFSSLPDNLLYDKVHTPFSFDTPIWLQGILFIIVIGIPLFFLLLLGLKLISNRIKSLGNTVNYSLLAIWIIGLAAVLFLTVKEISQNAYTGKDIQKELINLKPTDTLNIKFVSNNLYSKDIDNYESFEVIHDENNKAIIFSNDVSIRILQTDEPIAFLQIEKSAEGNNIKNAKKTAEKIKYSFKIENNNLVLDNYWITDLANKKHDQDVELFLYLPKGVLFKVDENFSQYDRSYNDYFNLHHSSDKYVYKVGESKILCTNCPPEENEYDDIENDTVTNFDENSEIILNEDGVLIKKGDKTVEKQNVESIKIDKDGVTIKSN
ncbi:PspC domain-containing protein [Flavobacterium difficile]|uniref:PspC domain-containing protein n=1 Tax=Flavobacterium difficile TaxID=2709659 RepID=A0ABX0I727_9FLAO|nr:PspC domain-containing protein [Flavobacterium difficile]NHM01300.1 PspC domain-containing protein [Flavobacterium difficile]